MTPTLVAYCGLDCARCDVFIATLRDDPELRAATATKWSEAYGPFLAQHLGRAELRAEEMSCRGCRSDAVFLGCGICPVRACCRERRLGTCAECAEYETCAMLNGFFGLHAQAKETLDRLRGGHRASSIGTE